MIKEIETPDSGRASYNINASFSHLIANRLASSQRLYDSNDFVRYFKKLRSIYELATHNLGDEVIKKMDNLAIKILRNQKYFVKIADKKNEWSNIKITDEDRKGEWIYVNDIRQFQRNLLKILKKSGYLTNTVMRSHLKF